MTILVEGTIYKQTLIRDFLIAHFAMLNLHFEMVFQSCSTIKLTASAPPKQSEAIPLLALFSFIA